MKSKTLMKRLISLCVLFCFFSMAKAGVVVIPMFDGPNSAARLANTITVSPSNGDFRDIQTAIDSVDDASVNSPYVIFVGPGRYRINKTIMMSEFVSIVGSGTDTTTLTSVISEPSLLRGCGTSKAVLVTETTRRYLTCL